jgi:hypothetical protein
MGKIGLALLASEGRAMQDAKDFDEALDAGGPWDAGATAPFLPIEVAQAFKQLSGDEIQCGFRVVIRLTGELVECGLLVCI